MMEDGSQWMMLLRALGSLGVVLALIFSLAYVAKRYFRPEKWASSITSIRVVQSLPIGAKKKLMLIEVEGRRVLVGVGNDSVNAICDLGEKSSSQSQDQKEKVYVATHS